MQIHTSPQVKQNTSSSQPLFSGYSHRRSPTSEKPPPSGDCVRCSGLPDQPRFLTDFREILLLSEIRL
ncbi:hypothetical protein Tco_0193880 [Tanacetum coccineum]